MFGSLPFLFKIQTNLMSMSIYYNYIYRGPKYLHGKEKYISVFKLIVAQASKYSDIKMKNTGEYQAVKIAVKKHLEQTGMGFWRDVRVPEF